jgi:DNA-binding transcriptional LysR family regulator
VEKEASIKTLAAVHVAMPDLVRPVGIVYRRQKPLTPTAERFVQMLHEVSAAPRAPARATAGAPA